MFDEYVSTCLLLNNPSAINIIMQLSFFVIPCFLAIIFGASSVCGGSVSSDESHGPILIRDSADLKHAAAVVDSDAAVPIAYDKQFLRKIAERLRKYVSKVCMFKHIIRLTNN